MHTLQSPSNTWSEDDADGSFNPTVVLPERYSDLGPLGAGGMGEVRRVLDHALQRHVALKVVRAQSSEAAVARFREEAQVAAQLQHPGIVPIHDIGQLEDGRLFFTMKEVRGTTLSKRIDAVHAAARRGQETTADGWSLRRLVDALARVSEAVGYAHVRGVVHRDLKPDNIMLGDFGEVMVLDWGLARVLSEGPASAEACVASLRTSGDSLHTRAGSVAGTPAYMAPEQARAEHDRIGPATDVWALGVILYEVLCGQPPYAASSREAQVALVADAPPVHPPQTRSALPVPEELAELAMGALAPRMEERSADARAIARELFAWLDGARNRERALELVHRADALLPDARRRMLESQELRAAAAEQLRALPADAPEALRWGPWSLEDDARRLQEESQRAEDERLRLLRASLTFVPDLVETHDRLADHYVEAHREAEQQGDTHGARRLEGLIRAHDRGRHGAYLKGSGSLSIQTDPPGASAVLHRYVERRRRLVPEFVRELGTTPLREVSLPIGSYVIELRAPGRETVMYPVEIARGVHWTGVRPGETQPSPVAMPRRAPLGTVYVPGGWFEAGTDAEALANPVPRQRVWVDSFFLGRDSVTNAEYLMFLNALVDDDREEEALRFAPQMGGRVVYPRHHDGQFHLGQDDEGSDWRPQMPVVCVSWEAATAYCAWLSERLNCEVRLPFELEWEKAARGVDGRVYPWGAQRCAEWSWTRERAVRAPGPCDVGTHPHDCSPYGVRDVVGNVMNWLQDSAADYAPVRDNLAVVELPEPTKHRRASGGAWDVNSFFSRIDTSSSSQRREARLGFRVCVDGSEGAPPPRLRAI